MAHGVVNVHILQSNIVHYFVENKLVKATIKSMKILNRDII